MLLITSMMLATTATLPPAPNPYEYTPAQPSVYSFAPTRPVLAADDDDDGYDFSYTYLELGYFSTDIDALGEKSDAYRGRASLGLFGLFFVFLDYTREDVDVAGGSVDANSYGLGAGAHFPLTKKLDLVGEISWLYDDLSSDTIGDLDDSNSGYSARVGARWMLLPLPTGGLEAAGGFRWTDRKGLLSDEETHSWDIGARFHFLKAFSVGANFEQLRDDQRYGLDARFSL